MDIRGSDAAPGGKVIAYDQLDVLSDNQLWYEDHRGIIRSKLNNYALDSSGQLLSTDSEWVHPSANVDRYRPPSSLHTGKLCH